MTTRLARPDADPAAGPPLEPVTGVASGALGTATNLDDTQRYSLDDLRQPAVGAAALAAPSVDPPEPSKPPPSPIAPARAAMVVARPRLRPGSRLPANRVGAIAVGTLVLALAAILTLRDGRLNGAGGGVDGVAGAAGTFPPMPAIIAAGTPAPVATPGLPGGHGNGRGHGHGHH